MFSGKKALLFVLLFSLALVRVSFCQDAQPKYTLQGRVVDINTQKPVPNAIVMLRWDTSQVVTYSDTTGFYKFPSAILKPDKMYVIFASSKEPYMYGYAGTSENYISTYGLGNNSRTFERNFTLTKSSVNAEPLVPTCVIHFAYKQSAIPNPAKDSVLNVWLKFLNDNPTYAVEIEGYADKKEGNKDFTLGLSRARALECINYFLTKDIEKQRIRIMGNNCDNALMDEKTIRKIKGTDAKMQARLLNCRAELRLVNMFYSPLPKITMAGTVTDATTGKPVKNAEIKFLGSDGTRITNFADSNGVFRFTVRSFAPVTYYSVTAEAYGYVSSDPDDVFRIEPSGKDMQSYTHNFKIEKNGYKKDMFFAPLQFDSASDKLTSATIDTLKRIEKYMEQNPEVVLEFMGDAEWREPGFADLALTRARACAGYLIDKGIDAGRFVIASRENEKSFVLQEKDTKGVIKRKEQQSPFNTRKCSVSLWTVRWDYAKRSTQ